MYSMYSKWNTKLCTDSEPSDSLVSGALSTFLNLLIKLWEKLNFVSPTFAFFTCLWSCFDEKSDAPTIADFSSNQNKINLILTVYNQHFQDGEFAILQNRIFTSFSNLPIIGII